jgi:hypothetical protein
MPGFKGIACSSDNIVGKTGLKTSPPGHLTPKPPLQTERGILLHY